MAEMKQELIRKIIEAYTPKNVGDIQTALNDLFSGTIQDVL